MSVQSNCRQLSRPLTRRAPALVVLAVAAALAAACSSSPSTTTATTAQTGSASTSSTSSTAAPAYEVTTGNVAGLGTVLVDGQGLTLYMFVPDNQSGRSTCYGTCAEGWPPLLLPNGVSAPLAGPGVNSSLLGTTTRTDGSVEVTYNKWPLYTWTGDSAPGQATGQAINSLGGLWYVLSPSGSVIKTKPASS